MPQVSVVSPAFCEKDNIPLLFEKLKAALQGWDWELIVVDDDSPDGTSEVARAIAQTDGRLRIIQRIRRRGLSGAVVEGMLASSAPLLAVIDADLQHDEAVLPKMLAELRDRSDVDVVIGTRYVEGGGAGGLDARRLKMSRFATRLAALVSHTPVSDPMSGFFALKREAFDRVAHKLSDQGFKILLDILASAHPPMKIAEVPFEFRNREHGESKLDTAVAVQYAELLLDKLIGRWVPVRMIKFAAVGTLGLFVHFATLFTAKNLGQSFLWSQLAATFVAMTWNYYLNNLFTFRDQRLRGWRSLMGLFSFYLVCSIGAAANVGVASYVFLLNQDGRLEGPAAHILGGDAGWWIAGIAGVAVGMVWNYAVSSRVTWGRRA